MMWEKERLVVPVTPIKVSVPRVAAPVVELIATVRQYSVPPSAPSVVFQYTRRRIPLTMDSELIDCPAGDDGAAIKSLTAEKVPSASSVE